MPMMSVRERGDQFRRLARAALADLFDQRRPFGRLALVHVLMTAGDTLFAISLAGSLFFSISPTAAKDKVLLYLLLTMGPFAVVAPGLGPLVDRSRGARRAMVVASALGRAALCPFIARDIHSLLLFPEAFVMLVLSKVYLVTKGALVPEMAALEGGAIQDDGAAVSPTTASTSERRDTPPYGTPMIQIEDPATGERKGEPDLATLNARLGVLASLAGFVAALPGVAALKLGGPPAVLWTDLAVFAAAVAAGARLPVRRRSLRERRRERSSSAPVAPKIEFAPDFDRRWLGDEEDLAVYRPIAEPPAMMALVPMSTLKLLGGFLTFLLAFGLRRQAAPTWWFGVLIGGLTVGSLVGVLLVGRIRRIMDERQMLVAALLLVAVATSLGAVVDTLWFEAVVAFAVGAGGSAAKPSFDALVQRHVAESDQGRAFAKFEARLQLMWVLGSLVPVVLSLPIAAGNAVMAALAVIGAGTYLSALRAGGASAGIVSSTR